MTDVFQRVIDEAPVLAAGLLLSARDAEEQQSVDLLLESIGSWADRHIDALAIDAAHTISQDLYRSAAELGLFGLTVPTEFGGAGLSLTATARVLEEIATYDRSVATAIGLHCGLGLRGLIRYGSKALKDRYLPELAEGALVAAFAATESEAGSHIAGVKTVARWDGASGLELDGSKCYVTNGGVAGVYTVLARTPGLGGARRGFSLLLLTRGMVGLTVGAEERKLGLRGTSTTTLSFDELKLDTSHVLGEPSTGLSQMGEVLAWGRTLMCAGCVGSARAAHARSVAHVQQRRQFGQPIGSFGLVAEQIARQRAAIYATESVVRLTTLLHDRCGADIDWPSAVAKVMASESAGEVADSALQLHGGAGYIEDTGIALIVRDCRITRIFEGANDVLRFNLAMLLLASPAADAEALPGKLHPSVAALAERFAGLHRELAAATEQLRARYGIRVGDHQILLGRLADAAIQLFAMLAVVLRASAEARATPAERIDEQSALARYTVRRLATGAEAALASVEATGEEAQALEVSRQAYA